MSPDSGRPILWIGLLRVYLAGAWIFCFELLRELPHSFANSIKSALDEIGSFLRGSVAGPSLLISFTLLWAAGALIFDYWLSPYWLALPACCWLACGLMIRRRLLALCLALAPLLSWGYAYWRSPKPGLHDLSSWIGARQIILRCRIIHVLPDSAGGAGRAVIAPEQMIFPRKAGLDGKAVLVVSGAAPDLRSGDQLEMRAQLEKPAVAVYPWQFNYSCYLRRQGVYCLVLVKPASIRLLKRANVGSSILDRLSEQIDCLRERMLVRHRQYAGQPEGDLLASMVIGDRAVKLPEEISRNFRDVGLSHILAASGFNLTLVTGVTFWLGRLMVRSILGANLLCFAAMLSFVCLAGPSPSVMRAALMCSLVLASRCLFRSLYAPAALAAALLVTMLGDPASLTDVGLQLSYAATIGIVSGARSLSGCLSKRKPRLLPAWLIESASVVLVVQAFVLPMQLAYFWQIGLFFLPANLLVVPIVTAVTCLGFLSSSLIILPGNFFDGLIALIDGMAAYPLKFMLQAVKLMASCEAAKLHLGPPPIQSICAYYVCLALLSACFGRERFRLFSAVAFIAALCWIVSRPALPELTVASFPAALVVMNKEHQALCLGDAGAGEPAKFLAYYGARVVDKSALDFQVESLGSLALINCCPAKCRILVIDGGAPVDPPAIAGIVKKAGAGLVMLSGETRRFHRRLDRIEQALRELQGVRILRGRGRAFILVAESGAGREVAFRRVDRGELNAR